MAEGREGHVAMVRVWYFVAEVREGHDAMVTVCFFCGRG